jgi:hypothetical protein
MTEDEIQALHDQAFAQMSSEPPEAFEEAAQDGRRRNRGVRGNKGGRRPPKPKILYLGGSPVAGRWRLVSATAEAIYLEPVTTSHG